MKPHLIFVLFAWCALGASGQDHSANPPASIMPISAVPISAPIDKPMPVPMGKPVYAPTTKPTTEVKPTVCKPGPTTFKMPTFKPIDVPKYNYTVPPMPVVGSGAASGSSASGTAGTGGSAASSSSSSSSGSGKGSGSSASSSSSAAASGKDAAASSSSSSSSSSGGKGGKTGASSSSSANAGNGAVTASSSAWSYAATNSDEVDTNELKKVYAPKRCEKFMPPSCGLKIPTCDPKTSFRRYDGSCNNLEHPEWGVPNSTYSRLLPPRYGDGTRLPRRCPNNTPLPSARKIRTEVFPVGQVENTLWNINAMLWGQFMAHDMSLLKEPEHEFACCTPEGKYVSKRGRFCYPVKVPPEDLTMGKSGIECMNFTRTMTDKDLGCAKPDAPAQQINAVTDYLDLSNVYGLNKEMADSLRTFSGGRMKTEVRNGHIFAPKETNMKDNCRCSLANENTCYMTGDSRSNQNPQLAILQTLFVREHNRIADELCKINPHWDDERLFQEARRISIAAYQRICYYEWLPIFLGFRNVLDDKITYNITGFVNDYDPKVPPTISNEHAHAAYRFFHTHIPGIIRLLDAHRQKTSTISMADWFHRPTIVEKGNNLAELTMSMLIQNLEETDNFYVEEVSDKLFACGKKFGIDLRAADIQRDRDHALSYYNDYRKYCKLKEAKSFEDFGDVISAKNIELLKTLYKNYTDVDLTVGGALEALYPGAQVGPTFHCILNEQFRRSRVGDRFWFENESSGLTADQLAEIRKATVSAMFCNCGDGVVDIQPIGFTLVFPNFNKIQPCSEIVRMDLTKWKETPMY